MTRRRPHALAPAILAAAVGGAGTAAGQPDGGESVDALRCWRRADRGAVRIGERFAMTLTCRAVDAGRGRAVPDTIGLEPETIDAQPFEVLGGERFTDVRDETGRTFQYRYALRLTGEDYFGRDVDLPPIAIGYRIERRADDGAVLAGRELTYVLPAEPIRVLSLVPDAADDIRGLPAGTLGEAEDRLLRANLSIPLLVHSLVLSGLVSCVMLQLPGVLWSPFIAVRDIIFMKQSDWSTTNVALGTKTE